MMACATTPVCSASEELRPYQEATIEAVRERLRAGRRAPCVVLPTGAGKTVVLGKIVGLHLERGEHHRVLVVAHRRELIRQIAKRLRGLGLRVAEIRPEAVDDGGAHVFVASAQTLLARGDLPVGVTLVIFDEAHHYSAAEWSTLTEAYPMAVRVGFTATPCRSDGRGLSPAFDSLVVGATIKELTEAGYLVRCRVIAPERPLRSRELAMSTADAVATYATGKKAIVFFELVADTIRARAEMEDRGIDAVVVHGELNGIEREEALRRHVEDGAVLLNVMTMTEGVDLPATSVCILARGCGSVGTYLQIAGRILRPFPGKTEALLVDLTGRAFHAHGAPDEVREFSLTGKGIRRQGQAEGMTCEGCGSLVDAWPCDVCGHQPEGVAAGPLRIVERELAERYAIKRTEDANKRIDTLARWMAEAHARGAKHWSAIRKFTGVYGRPPCGSYIVEARERAQAIVCTDCAACGRTVAKTYRGGRCGRCAFGGSQNGAAA